MKLQFNNKIQILNVLFYIFLIFTLILGVWARTRYYITGVPYWLDEILLGCNFSDMRFTDIFTPLDAYQKSPPFFVMGILICRKLFGMGELSLRLIPFVCGILSLFTFYAVCKNNINNKMGILAGTFAFAFCIPLIYMSGELKQYGCDVLITVLLILAYKHINFNNLNRKKTLIYSVCTIVIILTSFPALFTIPALILSKIITDKNFNTKILCISMSVIATGLFLYFYDTHTYDFMINYWNTENGFNLKFLLLYIPDACKYFIYNFNTDFITCVLMFTIGGLYILFRDKKGLFTFFVISFIFAIIAAITYIYPLKPKLCIYLLPMFIFIIAKSFDGLIIIKDVNIRHMLNITLFTVFLFVYGINIPYLNMRGDELAYYNKASMGRNKSVDDREAVKSYSKILLENTSESDKILASEEFLFSTKLYQYYYKFPKSPQVKTYKNIKREDLTKHTENFIKDNLHNSNSIWLAGRDYEYFFICPNAENIIRTIEKLNLKYKIFSHNDLYLIQIKNKSL